ncbi:hypothetical protein CAAN3_17S00364 [[Candida] anglica]
MAPTISTSDVRKMYSQMAKTVINFILAHPRSVILVPSIVVFLISYNVIYDFLIKSVNDQLQWLLNGKITYSQTRLPDLIQNLETLDWIHSKYTLTKISLSTTTKDVFTYSLINSIDTFQTQLFERIDPSQGAVVSPLSFWPTPHVDVSGVFSKYDEQVYLGNIMTFINSGDSEQLNTYFLKEISKSNSLITYANSFILYVINTTNSEGTTRLLDFLSEYSDPNLHVEDVISTSNPKSVTDFVRSILYEAKGDHYVHGICSFLVNSSYFRVVSYILFFGYVSLCILNQYKVRSKIGLLIGWFVEVLISSCSALAATSYLSGRSWKSMYAPSTDLATFSYVFVISLISSNNMLTILSYLSGETWYCEGENLLRIRLFKFFLGIDPVEYSTLTTFRRMYPRFSSWCPVSIGICKVIDVIHSILFIPPTTKYLLLNLFELFILRFVLSHVTLIIYQEKLGAYLSQKVNDFVLAIAVALVIDHLLQLTYLVSIITVDLKRFEFTDLINTHTVSSSPSSTQTNGDDSTENDTSYRMLPNFLTSTPFQTNTSPNEELFGVNLFSSKLLKLSQDPSLRPKRSSFRHKLGQALLKFKNPLPSIHFFIVTTAIQVALFIGTTFSWSLMVPHGLVGDESGIYDVQVEVIRNEFDMIYYLELLSVLMIIVASAGLTFKFAHSGSGEEVQRSDSIDSEFELEDESTRYFNSIDLFENGHKLDVLKVCTNSSSPFIVTVGLDHKIFIWSPLHKPKAPAPINISAKISDTTANTQIGKEFWPVNHLNISNDGNYTVLINYRHSLVKCYERKLLQYIWEINLPTEITQGVPKKFKILESFFRRRTVPGYLTRKIRQKKKEDKRKSRKRTGSVSSTTSTLLSFNGNYEAPQFVSTSKNDIFGISEGSETSTTSKREEKEQLSKDDFIMILESGLIYAIACSDGSYKTCDIFETIYEADERIGLKLNSVTKLSTPRVTDRIICHVNNCDIIVVSLLNNNFSIKKLKIQQGFYNKGSAMVAPLMRADSFRDTNDFKSICETPQMSIIPETGNSVTPITSSFQLNKAVIVTVEFVGMIVRVRDLGAELIDIQTGVLLKTFCIGHFKPNSFRVSHPEPTHCKFCGCASIQSFSLIYQDQDSDTLIMHTFKIDTKKSKNNICLRVERDPREIRCLGFNAVTEHQHWFDNIERWEMTDINMIIGIRKRAQTVTLPTEDGIPARNRHFSSITEGSGLSSLRLRGNKSKKNTATPELTLDDIWEGFIITANDGNLMNYRIPSKNASELSLSVNKVLCMEKFGYKSVVITFGNFIQVLYLGSDKLIEKDLYYSGANTGIASALPSTDVNVGVNNELLFINKRRMHRERSQRIR